MEFSVEKIKEAYGKASPKIQQIVNDSWVSDLCAEIGKSLNLRIDKIDALIKVIGYTLLNLVSINDFVKIIQTELDIPEDKAKELAKAVDNTIFTRVRKIVSGEDTELNNNFDLENGEDDLPEDYSLIKDIEEKGEDGNVSFKEKFNKVVEKKIEDRNIDPYAEPID